MPERPLWLAIMGLLAVLAAALIVAFRAAPASLEALVPVEVRVTPVPGIAAPAPELLALDIGATAGRHELPPAWHWRLERRPVSALGLKLGADWRRWLGAVELRVGDRVRHYAAADLEARWRRGDLPSPERGPGFAQAGPMGAARTPELWWAPAAELAEAGIVARRTTALNGVADAVVARRTLGPPALLALALIALMSLRQGWAGPLAAGAGAAPAAAAATAGTWLGFAVGTVAAGIVLLELVDPYYFSQGENLVRALPLALDACARLNQDAWPDFNFHQLLGMPTANRGLHGVSYPVLWASCLIADGLLGRATALYEVHAALHLTGAAAASFWLGRHEGLPPPLAAAFAISFALAGFFPIAGRSSVELLPLALWLPLLLLSARILPATDRPLRWALLSGLAIGLFYHGGRPELWLLAMLAWAFIVALAWVGGGMPWRRLLWALAALLLGRAVAMPLLVPEYRLTAGLPPLEAVDGHGIWEALAALLLPYPTVDANHPDGWGTEGLGSMSPLYYSGTLLTLAGALALAAGLAAWLRAPAGRQFWLARRWTLLALLALLLALGRPGFLWSLAGLLPAFAAVAQPFLLLPFLLLALNLAGALALQRLLPGRGPWQAGIAIMVALLALLNAGLARQSFLYFADDPFRPLPEGIAARLRPAEDGRLGARVLAGGPLHDAAPGYTASALGNLATQHRLLALNGDDSLSMATPELQAAISALRQRPRETLRAYGVRWVLTYTPPERPGAPAMPIEREGRAFAELAAAEVRALLPAVEAGALALYDLGPADPIAFIAERPDAPLPARLTAAGVAVDLPEAGGPRPVVLNFLWRPGLEVAADGAALGLGRDRWGRVVVEAPPGARRLELGYDGGWGQGLYYGAVLALVALALLVVTLRLDPAFGRQET